MAALDLFDSPATWRTSIRKLVHSYGLDALDRAGEAAPVKPAPPTRFLAALKRSEAARLPALGLREDVRLEGRAVAGGGLVVDGRLVHLVAFPAPKRTTRAPRAKPAMVEEIS